MTTMAEAREAIYQRFVDEWTGGEVYTFDNEDFTPPENANWARVAVRHLASTQETLGASGGRKFSRLGSVFVQIFTIQDTGTADVDTLSTRAREMFEGRGITGTTIRFYDVIVQETGPSGKWYQTTVEAQFEYDETR